MIAHSFFQISKNNFHFLIFTPRVFYLLAKIAIIDTDVIRVGILLVRLLRTSLRIFVNITAPCKELTNASYRLHVFFPQLAPDKFLLFLIFEPGVSYIFI